MKTKIFRRSFLLLFSFLCVGVSAQTTKPDVYRAGENLVYEAKFNKAVLRGIEVAGLNFTVNRAADQRNFTIAAEAKSKGTLSQLFLKDFLQKYESIVDGRNFSILKTVKRDQQGERTRDSEAVFDYKTKNVVYMETDPDNPSRPPRRAASAIENGTQDLVSALYALRRLPLAVGKTFELTISDFGLIYKIPVRVTGREQQKSILGKLWCFRVEPEVFGRNRLIEGEGSLIIWITDDARRLPVRSQINSNLGRVEVKLRQVR